MDEFTLFPVIKAALEARKWAGDSGNDLVFPSGSVTITNKDPEAIIQWGASRTPFAAIVGSRSDADPEEPTFGRIDYYVIIGTSPMGPDPTGEISVMGGHKVSGVGSSDGKGIYDLHEDIKSLLKLLTRDDGVTIVSRWRTSYDIADVPTSNPVVVRQMLFSSEF